MKEFKFEKPFIRKPAEPRKPAKTKEKTGKTSLEEDIRFTKEVLTKNPEIKQEPMIQKADRVGYFHFPKEIPEKDEIKEKRRKNVVSVKNGDIVKKDQIVGYLEQVGIQCEVYALCSGIISGLPEEGAPVEYNEELFTITPTSEK